MAERSGVAQFLPRPTPPSPALMEVIGKEGRVSPSKSKVNVVTITTPDHSKRPKAVGAAAMPIIYPPPQRPEVKQYEVQIKNMEK